MPCCLQVLRAELLKLRNSPVTDSEADQPTAILVKALQQDRYSASYIRVYQLAITA